MLNRRLVIMFDYVSSQHPERRVFIQHSIALVLWRRRQLVSSISHGTSCSREIGPASGDVSKGLIKAAAVLGIGVYTPLFGLSGDSWAPRISVNLSRFERDRALALEILIFHALIPKIDEKSTSLPNAVAKLGPSGVRSYGSAVSASEVYDHLLLFRLLPLKYRLQSTNHCCYLDRSNDIW